MTGETGGPLATTRAVLFDLFGTLLIYGDMTRAWGAWLETLHRFLLGEGLTADLEEFEAATKGFFSKPEPELNAPGDTVFDRRLIALASELGLALTPDAAARIRRPAIDAWMVYVTLDPEAPALLRELSRTHKVALVSNFDAAEPVVRILEEQHLTPFFDVIAVSDAVGSKKPSPEIFHWTLERLGVEPEEAVHVGDMEDDIDGARAAGIQPVLIERWDPGENPVDYHYDGEPPVGSAAHRAKAGPDGLIHIKSLAELRELLRRG
ncbi:MAG: HAD-IA family hydrolase [Armatimonadia bacterium]|nr:HAD-IA family hydrolase [Armatimonadia bacterium]